MAAPGSGHTAPARQNMVARAGNRDERIPVDPAGRRRADREKSLRYREIKLARPPDERKPEGRRSGAGSFTGIGSDVSSVRSAQRRSRNGFKS
jgi:hypothetical protein